MTTVTLIDGSECDSASEAWRLECYQRHTHVLNMRRLDLHRRRDYLATVGRKEGAEAEMRLRDAFSADWEQRKEDSK